MNNEIFDAIYNGLSAFLTENNKSCYSAKICSMPPANPTYPLVMFDEVRNVKSGHSFGEIPDKVSSLGYQADIYGKAKGTSNRRTVARAVATVVDSYLSDFVGLHRMSFNVTPVEAGGELYRITIMYDKKIYENKKSLIN